MAQLRERWEGVSLPGDYLLEKWTGGDDAAGFFETALTSDGRRLAVKLVAESAADGASQLALWERARALGHPNLREVLDCGRAELAGEIVVYGVFEAADDTLAEALARSPLSETEAREVLVAVRDGLQALQAAGLALAALQADCVVAVGDRIKLSTVGLRVSDTTDAGGLRTFWEKISPCTPARSEEIFAQVTGTGAAAAGSLTERFGSNAPPVAKAPGAGRSPAQGAPREVGGAPNRTMSGGQATGAAAAARAAEVPAAGTGSAAPTPAGMTLRTGVRPPTVSSASPAAQLASAPLAAEAATTPAKHFPLWVLVGGAAVVLLILGLNLARGPEKPPASAHEPKAATPAGAVPAVLGPQDPKTSPFGEKKRQPESPQTAAAGTVSAMRPAAEPATRPATRLATQAASERPASPKAMWRVIAFTYVSREAAGRKADQINQANPGFEASAFAPPHKPGWYLVALGGFMTREEAVRVQKKALAERISRDVFVHNYIE